MRSKLDPRRDESGVAMVVIAAGMLALLMVAALVVDLGSLRLDRRADSLAADAASTAGVSELDPFAASDGEAACETAWAYLLINVADEGTPTTTPFCQTFAGACDSGVARVETATAGSYQFEIVYPVPDNHAFMTGQALNTEIDGAPCQRLGVRVQRERDFIFAGVAGFGSATTDVHSVARIGTGVGQGELVPLLLLEPIACDAIFTSGQGKITVSPFQDVPGIIVVDSDASKSTNPNRCGNNTWSIDSKGNLKGWIRAIPVPGKPIPAAILSYALSGAVTADPTSAFDPGDLVDPVDPADISDPALEPPESWFRLYPEPTPVGRRITRAPIDWRYNCKTNYPDYPRDVGDPSLGGVPILDCPDAATTSPYIDNLRATYGGADSVGINPPGSFQQWSTFYSCDLQPSDLDIVDSGDWWIDCPGGFTIRNNVTLSGGSIVADGPIRVFGSLSINDNATGDELAYLRVGDFLKDAQAEVSLDRTFVYIDNGIITFGGGDGGLFWIAPLGGGDNPTATDFEDLALWSESSDQHSLGGQAGNILEGTLFTPNADPFVLTGQAGQFQTAAQFLTRRLEVKGQGEVSMHPDPDRITLVPVRAILLIR